jgi:Mn2+/Fe2+ NRAMP family transporter
LTTSFETDKILKNGSPAVFGSEREITALIERFTALSGIAVIIFNASNDPISLPLVIAEVVLGVSNPFGVIMLFKVGDNVDDKSIFCPIYY